MKFMGKTFGYTLILVMVIGMAFSLMMLGSAQPEDEDGPVQPYAITWNGGVKFQSADSLKVYDLKIKSFDKPKFVSMSDKILAKVEPNAQIRALANFNNALEFKNDMEYRLYKMDGAAQAAPEAFRGFFWQDKLDPTSFINFDARTGDILFQNQFKRFMSLPAVQLPDKIQAESLARSFIKDVELMPADFEANGKLLAAIGLFSQECKDGNYGLKIQKALTLHFGREIDGIPVEGPGSKMIVQLGNQGRVLTFIKKWNDIAPAFEIHPDALRRVQVSKLERSDVLEPAAGKVEKLEIKPGREFVAKTPYLSEAELRAAVEAKIRGDWDTPLRAEERDVQLVYFDRSGQFIQPAYAVQVALDFENNESFNVLYHIAALHDPPEALEFTADLDAELEDYALTPDMAEVKAKALDKAFLE